MIIKEKVKKVNPLDQFKNLHGHVCIDLHNHNSGFTERVEADNMVTNALSDICLRYLIQSSDSSHFFFPIANKALGGIILFDDALTENVNNTDLNSEAHVVAFAGQTANSSDTYAGSYNAIESKKVSDGFVSVWDFGTSQANGVIESLARTHSTVSNGFAKYIAANYYWIETTTGVTGDTRDLYIDDTTGYVYYLRKSSSVSAVCRISEPYEYSNVPVSFSARYETASVEIVYDGSELETPNIFTCYSYRMGDDGYLYGVINETNPKLFRLKIKNEEFTHEFVGTFTQRIDNSQNAWVVSKGYIYFIANDRLSLYKVNLSNLSDVTAINVDFTASSTSRVLTVTNGGVIVTGGYSGSPTTTSKLIYPDGVVLDYNLRGELCPYGGIPIYVKSGMYIDSKSGVNHTQAYYPQYLGTIANIEPVTKTAAQSMKVTYTLTNE